MLNHGLSPQTQYGIIATGVLIAEHPFRISLGHTENYLVHNNVNISDFSTNLINTNSNLSNYSQLSRLFLCISIYYTKLFGIYTLYILDSQK